MDRHRQDNGFTLAELCIAIWILGMLTLCALPFAGIRIADIHSFPDEYLCVQSRAMLQSRPQQTENGITFNEHGNVNLARTLHYGAKQVIIELGGGRLVFR